MQVKTYIDKSLPKALFKAKQELGDDIVILESKEIDNHPSYPGTRMVHVTVGHTSQKGSKQKEVKKWMPPNVNGSKTKTAKKTYPELTQKYRPHAKVKSAEPSAKTAKDDKKFNDMIGNILNRKTEELDKEKEILNEISMLRKEITELSKKTEKPLPGPDSSTKFPAVYSAVEEMLKENGLQDDMAYTLVSQAYLLNEGKRKVQPADVIKHIKTEMTAMLKPFDFKRQLRSRKQKVILLVGPTGVGKTTMAMKLTANPEIYGNKKVTILSTDPYGPSEALKAFSRMSDAQIHEEKNIEETENILEKYKTSDVLIVDTPGKSPFAPNQLSKLEHFIKVLKPTDIFLVLSVGSDLKDLVLLCANYLLLKPTGIVFTKFDETTQPGKVFSILDVINLPVACFGGGKRIFLDLAKGDPKFMFDKLFDSETKEI